MTDSTLHPGFVPPNDPAPGPSQASPGSSRRKVTAEDNEDLSDSELFDALEAELEDEDSGFNMSMFRERRMAELQEELASREPTKQDSSYLRGKYTNFTNEKELMKHILKEKYGVVHFAHRDFRRCKIMDKHMENVAPRNNKTVFARILVEDAPFLVEKLQIKVLPCVVCFVDGASKDRLIGFEELGNKDSFASTSLEFRLQQAGVIQKKEMSILGYPDQGSLRSAGQRDDFDD